MSGFFLMSKTHCFLNSKTEMQACSLLLLPYQIKVQSHPNSDASAAAERQIISEIMRTEKMIGVMT